MGVGGAQAVVQVTLVRVVMVMIVGRAGSMQLRVDMIVGRAGPVQVIVGMSRRGGVVGVKMAVVVGMAVRMRVAVHGAVAVAVFVGMLVFVIVGVLVLMMRVRVGRTLAVQAFVAVAVGNPGGMQGVVVVIVAGVLVPVLVFMGMGVFMFMGMAVHGTVRVAVSMLVLVAMDVLMAVWVLMVVGMGMIVAFDLGFTLAAAADSTHACSLLRKRCGIGNGCSLTPALSRWERVKNYSTSKSLTRISVPPVACTW